MQFVNPLTALGPVPADIGQLKGRVSHRDDIYKLLFTLPLISMGNIGP